MSAKVSEMWLSENCQKIFILSKNRAKFGTKSNLEKIVHNNEILSTRNLLCRKFAASIEKLQLFAPTNFLTH